MANVFRNVRQKHFSENNFGEYLKYALSEIILVVLGILIALYINNKNEEQKTKGNDELLLTQLKNENLAELEALRIDFTYRDSLLIHYSQFVKYIGQEQSSLNEEKLTALLSSLFRTSGYSFSQNHLVNYINQNKRNDDVLNYELLVLKSLQEGLEYLSIKGFDMKTNYFFEPLATSMDFETFKILDFQTFNKLEFRNKVTLLSGLEEEITYQFKQTVRQQEKVDSILTTVLKD